MIVTASVETCTGHRLMEYEGKCAQPHGHNYLWTAEVQSLGRLIKPGFVVDFAHVKRVLKDITDKFDHAMVLRHDDPLVSFLLSHNNKLVVLDTNPTAEYLSTLVQSELQELFDTYGTGCSVEVEIRETKDCTVKTQNRLAPLVRPRILEIRS